MFLENVYYLFLKNPFYDTEIINQRFLNELNLIDKNTKKEIEDSLKQKELSLTKEEIYPINYL